MSSRRPFTISLLTVGLLIALRVAVGWHFFQEGLSHKHEPKWSSESFLRQAKGPFADVYQAMVPGFHRGDRLLIVPLEDAAQAEETKKQAPESSQAYGAWYIAIVDDWTKWRDRFATFYDLDDEQRQRLGELLDRYRANLTKVLAGFEEDIAGYRHELFRNQEMAGGPKQGWQIPLIEPEKKNPAAAAAQEIPYLKERLARRESNPTGEPGINVETGPPVWTGEVQALEAAKERDALALRTDAQHGLGPMPEVQTDLQQIDMVVIWTLIVGGGCLVVGLFTRLAALVLAGFLGSIIVSQPAWIAGTVPTYFQCVEFVALLLLASSRVGRWGGLDFFVHHLITRPLGWAGE